VQPAHSRREILPAQVVAGKEKRDARFPCPFRGAQADRFKGLFRLRPPSRLEAFRRAGELGVEVRQRGALADVADGSHCRNEKQQRNKKPRGGQGGVFSFQFSVAELKTENR
jgi:hypothetical protein